MIDVVRLKQEVKQFKFDFGRAFQCKLVLALLYDKAFFLQIKDTLSPSYFEDEGLSWLVRNIIEYYNEYKQQPTFDTIGMMISGIDNDTLAVLVNRTIKDIASYDDNLYQDAPFVKKNALEFCIRRDVSKMVIEIDNSLHMNESLDDITEKVHTMKKTITIRDKTSESCDYKRSKEDRYSEGAVFRECVPTGWPVIDEIMKGGLGKGELGIIIAPTGVGKSWGLVNMAVHAAKMGFNVAYISLELYTNVVSMRFDSVLSGIKLDDLFDHKDIVHEKLSQLAGNIYVEYAPMRTLTVDALEARLEKYMMSGVELDAIFIDYGDLLKSVGGHKEKRLNLEELFEEIRSLAGKLRIPAWTATQSNREGSQSEAVEGYHLAEAFSKLNPADFAMSFQRLSKDRKKGLGNCNIIKNRFGDESDLFMMQTELARGHIELHREDSEQGQDIKFQANQVNAEVSQQQQDRIKNIINSIKKT